MKVRSELGKSGPQDHGSPGVNVIPAVRAIPSYCRNIQMTGSTMMLEQPDCHLMSNFSLGGG